MRGPLVSNTLKQMGHSSPSEVDVDAARPWLMHCPIDPVRARLLAGSMTTTSLRDVPIGLTLECRKSFVEIALRARSEQVNVYSVLCLGLQAYRATKRLEPLSTADV